MSNPEVPIGAAELAAQSPVRPALGHLNPKAQIPHGVQPSHVLSAMQEFTDWLGFINEQTGTRGIPRLESMLMPANFSSIVGEFMTAAIPKFCSTITKNQFHNGHPDLIPTGMYPNNSIQHASVGIEIKGSRYTSGWQGHNPEDTWLMVFVFNSNRPVDETSGVLPFPFRFKKVVGAALTKDDWQFSGRSETSRRTITASVRRSGYDKMEANWIYRDDSA